MVGWGGVAHWPCSSHCSFLSAGSAEGGYATFSSASCARNTKIILIDKGKAAAPFSMMLMMIITLLFLSALSPLLQDFRITLKTAELLELRGPAEGNVWEPIQESAGHGGMGKK